MDTVLSRAGVAISTTGDEHRLPFLETCVQMWDAALQPGDSLFVTVDGGPAAVERVRARLQDLTSSVYRVGQTFMPDNVSTIRGLTRQGVAVNKNTGLELLMDNTRVRHLFLSDDDTWPLYAESLYKHEEFDYPHSMVCWGKSRLDKVESNYASWSWPRGVVLYQTREVVEAVGGMDERFGGGGHEHVEYSERIHNYGFTPVPFITPASYATRNGQGAAALWHGEDMPRLGENLSALGARRRRFTSVRHSERDWEHINKIRDERKGSTDFVAFRAHENGRASATLCADLMGQGAGGEL